MAGEPGLTPRSKKVIELAMDEARRLNNHYIGTEHLLLGLVREGEGIAAGVLESHGVSLESVRQGVMQVVSSSSSYRQTQEPLSGPPPYQQAQVTLAAAQEASDPAPVLPVVRVRAGQTVYGLTLPADTMAKLVRVAQDAGRSLDSIIEEAVTQMWVQSALDRYEGVPIAVHVSRETRVRLARLIRATNTGMDAIIGEALELLETQRDAPTTGAATDTGTANEPPKPPDADEGTGENQPPRNP